ncbi:MULTISPECIES: divergent polysaccharide deacetylase family protein [unclassified Ochrobactrum]|uniref:divergent polysaccharide deacetylase family protein n=1 Tax=unclassified Ochrobactrum TaxID=239106 RepID=UPI000DEFB4BC|nr:MULTISPECIES: divergent polysaccharide deacetylase family protein [unclassified Ochrobactrum]MBQ0711113.1 divergent polysaccharide deacetylase family protein [Ochrobactrum sp. AP1BH01-1]
MLDLNSPLGLDKKPQERGGLRSRAFRSSVKGLAVVAGLCLAGGAVFAIWQTNQAGFRKTETAALEPVQPEASAVKPDVKPATGNTPPPGSALRGASGQPGPAIIKVTPDMPPGMPNVSAGAEGNVVVVQNTHRSGQDQRVAHLPEPALVEQGPTGPLPVRGADGLRPMDAYAVGWSGARGARIALVIGGLGLSQTGSMEAVDKLPPEVTLGFAPQGNSLQRWMQAARQNGHELVLQLPMEPFDYPRVNPGRNTLTVDDGAKKNEASLLWALSRMTNYAGVMNYMGARFTSETEAFSPVLGEIGRRGLYYLDDGTSARSQADRIAESDAVPFAAADVLIDAAQERGAILDRLDELERIARANGSAIGTGSAFAVTVDAVAEWADEVKKRGIEIVPVSALVRDPERQ